MRLRVGLDGLYVKDVVRNFAARLGLRISRIKAPQEASTESLTQLNRMLLRTIEDVQGSAVATQFLRHCATHLVYSKSQLLQDLFCDWVLQGRSSGTYCEFGATDGVSLSNTYFLSRQRAWRGVLAEPGHRWQGALKRNRPESRIDARCVYSVSGQTVSFLETDAGEFSTIEASRDRDHYAGVRKGGRAYEVSTVSLNDLLDEHGIKLLDYLSVDTEGTELEILAAFDFDRYSPAVITVEHNFTASRAPLNTLITSHGYVNVFPQFSIFDDWYVKRGTIVIEGL